MIRLFKLTLLLLLILSLPLNVVAVEELHAIKGNAPTSKFYERAMELFTKKMPGMFEQRLDNSSKYIDFITEVFEEKGIPVDIAYLPLIESGFSPLSVGRGNAVGLWQFVKGTARQYGLRIDNYVDERKDPIKSTEAAARYLKDLYGMFGAWDIALAAYNAGDGKIKRIFRNKSMRLPQIVYRYLAKFMAASTIAQEPESFGIKSPEDVYEYMDYVEITTDKVISLEIIAKQYDTTVKAIKELNPALLTNQTPPYRYILRLPGI